MKLIDVDKFVTKSNIHGIATVEEVDFDELCKDITEAVRNMPEVKAIPIDWIKKWEIDNWEIECNYGIDMMIED